MRRTSFATPADYDALLERGIRLSGEDRTFFIRGRLADLLARLPRDAHPRRILDYGCGSGDAVPHLASAFPDAAVVGADDAPEAVAWARAHHHHPRIAFTEAAALGSLPAFDLAWMNGVLHHVAPPARAAVLRRIHDALVPAGL